MSGVVKVTLNGATLIDHSDATVEADKVLSSYIAYEGDGDRITGSYVPTPSGYTIDDIASKSISGAVTISTDVKERAFYQYTGLTSVTIDGQHWIYNYAFANCSSLTTLNVPDLQRVYYSNYSASSYVFQSCNSLTTVVFPSYGNYALGTYLFYNSTGLNTVDLANCSNIQNAFNGCTGLRKLIIRRTSGVCTASVSGVQGFAGIYSNPNDSVIYVPNSLVASYQTASNWSALYNLNNNIFQKIEGTTYETHWADGTLIGS